MDFITEHRQVPIRGQYDLIVCGGGISGLAAAVAAARQGVRVLLLEKSVQLGGLATLGLISWFEPICDGKGRRIVGGIPKELFDLCVSCGIRSLDEKWLFSPDGNDSTQRCATHFSHSIFALVLEQWLEKNHVQLLYDTVVTAANVVNNRLKGVFVENKDGRSYYQASFFIDATGDADLACTCGIEHEDGINYLTHIAYYSDTRHAAAAAERQDMLYARSWRNSGSDLWGRGHPAELPVYVGISAAAQTSFILEGRKRLLAQLHTSTPQQRDITCLPGMAQYRKSRRIVGEYTLTQSDCGAHFSDSVGIICDFSKPGNIYELPYRTLYHRSITNLFVAGRCISSTGWAWDVTRVIPAAAATGEAAGVACALCLRSCTQNHTLDLQPLQSLLTASGVQLHGNE